MTITPYNPILAGLVDGQPAYASQILNNLYAIQTTTDSIGTDLVSATTSLTTLTNGSAHIFNVKNYGAIGDGTADDTTAINNCLTAAYAYATYSSAPTPQFYISKNAVVVFPGGTYKLSGEIIFDIAKATFIGCGSMLVWTDNGQYSLSVCSSYGTSNLAFRNSRNYIEGFYMTVSSAVTSTSKYLCYLGKRTGYPGTVGETLFRNCSFNYCPGTQMKMAPTGISGSTASDVYLCAFQNCVFRTNGASSVGVDFTAVNSNSGERMVFDQCLFDNAGTKLKLDFGASLNSIFVNNCSLDGLDCTASQIVLAGSGFLYINSCHIEQTLKPGFRLVDLSGFSNGVTCRIRDSVILPRASGTAAEYFFKMPNATRLCNTRLIVENCDWNLQSANQPSTKTMVEGDSGEVVFRNNRNTYVGFGFSTRIRLANNELSDGSFDFNDPLTKTASVTYSNNVLATNQFATGVISVSTSTSFVHPGGSTRSLKIAKTSAVYAGLNRAAYVVPISRFDGRKLSGRIWGYLDTTASGSTAGGFNFDVKFVKGWFDSNNVFNRREIESAFMTGESSGANITAPVTPTILNRSNCFSSAAPGTWVSWVLNPNLWQEGPYLDDYTVFFQPNQNGTGLEDLYLMFEFDMTLIQNGDALYFDDIELYAW